MAFPEDPLGVRIRIAPEADLTAMPDDYPWQDITQDVSFSPSRPITIKAGSADEQQESNADTSLVLRNFSSRVVDPTGTPHANAEARRAGPGMQGRYSTDNPESDLYPNFDLGTPFEVAVDPGTGYAVQGVLYLGSAVDSWPGRVPGPNIALTTVTLRGLLARLSQSRDPRSALDRSLWPVAAASQPTDRWSMESATVGLALQTSWPNSNTAGAAASSAPMYAGSSTGPVGSNGIPEVEVILDVNTYAGVHPLTPSASIGDGVNWRVGGIVGGTMPDATDSVCAVYARIESPTGDLRTIDVLLYSQVVAGEVVVANSGYDLFGKDSSGTNLVTGTSFGLELNPFDGLPHYLEVELSQLAGTIEINIYVDGEIIITDTVAASAGLGCPRTYRNGERALVSFGPLSTNNVGLKLLNGHVYYTNLGDGDGDVHGGQASLGWPGEMAHERTTRLCAEESVPCVAYDEDARSTVMGPQLTGSLVPLLRECEKADYAILDDHLGYIDLVLATEMMNQAVGMTIDGDQHQLSMPFDPTTDDQKVANEVVASHAGGGPGYRYTDAAHVARVGRYGKSVTPNVLTDSQDANQAAWAVHLGTVRGKRYPSVTVEFHLAPDLIPDWLDPPVPLTTPLGMRVSVVNPPRQHRKGSIESQVRGYEMTIVGRRRWTVVANTVPYLPWEVNVIQTGTGNRSRLANGGCTLGVSRDGDDTSFTLVSSVCRWIDSATYPSMFPFDCEINGEQVTVTAITGTTLTQTATVTRSVNGVVRSHTAGSTFDLWRPAAIAL